MKSAPASPRPKDGTISGKLSDQRGLAKRHRLRPADVLATATLGPRTRLVRSLLSALGIAIGVAALVAMLGIPASQQAQTNKEMAARGANLITVYPGQDRQTGEVFPLPETAPAMLERINPVTAVVTLRGLDDARVYRNDKIPAYQSGAINAAVAQGDIKTALEVQLADGRWFDASSLAFPTAVLGRAAAESLSVGVGHRIWVDQSWWAVIGVLQANALAPELDGSVFLAPEAALAAHPDLPIQCIYVASLPGKTKSVRAVAAATANPANPHRVQVNQNDQMIWVQHYMFEMFGKLALGLGAVALLVGAIGIANTMVVAVMERRGEVGLRRAMGARTGQIAMQFVLEAALIGLVGGLLGLALGAYLVYLYTAWNQMAFAIPPWVFLAGPATSMLIGAVAGLYPSLKAARVSPTVALRAI